MKLAVRKRNAVLTPHALLNCNHASLIGFGAYNLAMVTFEKVTHESSPSPSMNSSHGHSSTSHAYESLHRLCFLHSCKHERHGTSHSDGSHQCLQNGPVLYSTTLSSSQAITTLLCVATRCESATAVTLNPRTLQRSSRCAQTVQQHC
jgi:hypothetical protein